MRKLNNLTDANVGDTIQFVYYGGSTPGSERTVKVETISQDYIMGKDISKDEYRCYLNTKATSIVMVDQPIVAEAVCDPTPLTNTRQRTTCMSFVDARQRLHDQIDELNGEDLATLLAEVDGEDQGTFNVASGEVIMTTTVPIPHCEVNDNAHDDAAGIDWVNEDGQRITTVFFHDGNSVRLFIGNTEVSAEDIARQIAQHFGLTNQ